MQILVNKSITLYDSLQVSPNANSAVIRAAFKALSQKLHPDKHQNSALAHEKFHIIKHAYEVLSNPESRQQYDLWMHNQADKMSASETKSKQIFNYYSFKEKKSSISVKV